MKRRGKTLEVCRQQVLHVKNSSTDDLLTLLCVEVIQSISKYICVYNIQIVANF
jgi:hypothetical protein